MKSPSPSPCCRPRRVPAFFSWWILLLHVLNVHGIIFVVSFMSILFCSNIDMVHAQQQQRRQQSSGSSGSLLDMIDLDLGGVALDWKNRQVRLPDISVDEVNVLGFPLWLNMTNLICRNIDFDAFLVDYAWSSSDDDETQQQRQQLEASFTIAGMDLSCTVDFETSWFLYEGKGKVRLQTVKNRVNTKMLFEVPSAAASPSADSPSATTPDATDDDDLMISVTVSGCTPNFNIVNLYFEKDDDSGLSGVAFFVMNALESVLSDTVEIAMERASCEVVHATEEMVEQMLANVTAFFRPYYYANNNHNHKNPTDDASLDEQPITTIPDDNVTLINYNDPSSSFLARVINFGVKSVGQLLGKRVDEGQQHNAKKKYENDGETAITESNHHEDENNNDGNHNLFINTALSSFLDQNQSLTIQCQDDGEDGIRILNSTTNLLTTTNNALFQHNANMLVGFADKFFGITDVLLDRVQIHGLDSFVSFGGFSPQAGNNHTLQIEDVALRSMSITIYGHVEVEEEGDDGRHVQLLQPFEIQATVDNINASALVYLALDESALTNLRVRNLLTLKDILCNSLGAVHDFQLLSFDLGDNVGISVKVRATPTTEQHDGGSNSNSNVDESKKLLVTIMNSDILGFGLSLYENVIIESLPELLRQTLPDLVKGMSKLFSKAAACYEHQDPNNNSSNKASSNIYLDFRDLVLSSEQSISYGGSGMEPYGNLVSKAKTFVDETLLVVVDDDDDNNNNSGTTMGLLQLNRRIIRPMTEQLTGVPGSLAVNGTLFNVQQSIILGDNFHAEIGVGIANLQIENLDTFALPTALVDPKPGRPDWLSNRLRLGLPSSPLRIKANVLVGVTVNDEAEIRNEFKVELETDSIDLLASVVLKLLEKSFLDFPVDDLMDLQCWLAAVAPMELDHDGYRINGTDASISLPDFDISVGKLFRFNLECIKCSGPAPELVCDMANKLDDEGSFASPDEIIQAFISFVMKGDSSIFQTQLSQMLRDAPKHCRHHPKYDPNVSPRLNPIIMDIGSTQSTSEEPILFLIAVLAVAGFAVLGSIAAAFVIHAVVSLRYRRWLATLPHDRVLALYRLQQVKNQRQARVNSLSDAMFKSKHVSPYVRWLVPALLLTSAAFFLSGFFSEAVMVRVKAEVGGRDVYDTALPFTVAKVATETWKLGGKLLALFVVVGSGLWPQLKQFGTLALWFLPPSLLPVGARNLALRGFDFLGKWTMASVFLFFIAVAVFRFEIASPKQFLSDDLYNMDILIVPAWGLYATSIAHILALVTSQICIRCHCHIVASTEQENNGHHRLEENEKQDNSDTEDNGMDHSTNSDKSEELVEHTSSSNTPEHLVEHSLSSGALEVSLVKEVRALLDDEEVQVVSTVAAAVEPRASGLSSDVNLAPSVDFSAKPQSALSVATYTRAHHDEFHEQVRARSIVNYAIFVTGCLIPGLVVSGCIFPSFTRDITGIAGLMVDFGREAEGSEEYSVFITTARFMETGRLLDSPKYFAGHLWLAALLIMTVCFAPIIQSLALLVQWFLPLTQRWRHKVQISIDILQSSQSIEVFLLSAVMFALQLGGITQTIAPSACIPLENITFSLASQGLINESDAQCFGYDGSVDFAALLLLFAVLLLYLLTTIVSLTLSQQQQQQQHQHFAGKMRDVAALEGMQRKQDVGVLKVSNSSAAADQERSDLIGKIRHAPDFFSAFRWLFTRHVGSLPPEHETDESSVE